MAGRNRKGAITTTIARTGARRSQAFADNEPPDRGAGTDESPTLILNDIVKPPRL